MSSSTVLDSYPAGHSTSPVLQNLNIPNNLSGSSVRRQGNVEQGKALEVLGHAVEYLVDSQMFRSGAIDTQDDSEATSILMRLSREVFNECTLSAPMKMQVFQWINRRMREIAH